MKKTKKKTLIIVIISVVIVLALAISAFFIIKSMNNEETQADSNGVVGKVSAGWNTGLPEESKKSTESSSSGTQIPGYGTAKMKAGDTQLHLSIGNPKENNCGFYATLQLEDGTVLYKSELLKPGYGLTEVPLQRTLKKGTYDAEVFYECVTLDEEQSPLNSAKSKFKLVVN
ncbi:MAG: hypothetical protein SOT80_10915 [Candidatus Pseudoruminococcus sp.]|nr:hypothetical protein [Ruminococcus sp.]MDY2783888.1 hypothetical protein [Candidatus Pseudoruminococcus sp.]